MKFLPVLALAAAAMPAQAQLTPTTPTQGFIDLQRRACLAALPNISTRLPAIARAGHWDEYGRTARTPVGARAWLVAVSRTPAIVALSRTADGGESCSVSAATIPQAIVSAIASRRGSPRHDEDGHYSWPADSKGPATVVSISGIMVGVTITAPRR